MRTGENGLLVATRNQGKLSELVSLLRACPYTLVSLAAVGIDEDVPETGSTLEENASLKAATYARLSGMLTLSDDTGLEVEALGGEPGPLSSRYAGLGATDAQRIEYLLRKLDNVPETERNARFRCAIILAWPGKAAQVYTGECEGIIIKTPRGTNGFGYDPVFLLPELGKTMAELTLEEKNAVSHRSKAARKVLVALNRDAAERKSAGGCI